MKNISRIKDQTSTKNDVNDKYEFQKKKKSKLSFTFSHRFKKDNKANRRKKN